MVDTEGTQSDATKISRPRTWIFQANPAIYDVAKAVRELELASWSVRQHQGEIQSGDHVIIWQSGSDGGVVALGTITSNPTQRENRPEELAYFAEPPELELRVDVRIERVLDEPIPRQQLLAEPGLASLSILRAPQSTNFVVTPSEENLLTLLLQERPTFETVIRRYHDDNVVYQSTERAACYAVAEVDAGGFNVDRLSADQPERCTFASYDEKLNEFRQSGGKVPYSSLFSNTVAIRASSLQGPDVALSADKRIAFDVGDESAALSLFQELVTTLNVDRSQAEPKLYKPAILACIIEAVDSGELFENKFDFDWLLPRFITKMQQLGQEVEAQQAAQGFTRLANDLFWMLAYNDVQQRVDLGSVTPAQVRERVRFATLKEPFWYLLRLHRNRQAMLAALQDTWWPDAGMPRFWWVNQGKTYDKEREGGVIWAPQTDKRGVGNFHWENVSKVRKGDIVFSYANGFIAAVSVANTDGHEAHKPEALSLRDEWQREGWLANLDYYDVPTPVPLSSISEGIRKVAGKYSPINRTGGVNQGYLYLLSDQAARVIAEQLTVAIMPDQIRGPLQRLLADQWEAFIYWGKRFFQTGEVRKGERDYKIEIAEKLTEVKEVIHGEASVWLDKLKRSFGSPNNLTFHISHSRFLKWCAENQQVAGDLLPSLWDSPDADTSLADFLDALPKEAVSGSGTRVNIASFLAMERDPAKYPVYKTEPFELGCKLTGYQSPPKDEKALYPHAISFLDRIVHEADQRGFKLTDRLDAQSLLWCVTKYDPPIEWSDADKKAFLKFREGHTVKEEVGGSEKGSEDPLVVLAERLYLDVRFFHEIERLALSKGQLIFFGPPGTGKTFVAKELARHFAASGDVELVQFHPSYTYEDFVEGYRPHLHNGQPGFELVPGPLRIIADKARSDPDTTYVLLIDEINRGNIAKVFGELYFLLEYRDEGINLQYSRDTKFSLPQNLWIIGTMNTADRSIALIDAALRRRFYFVPFFPDEPPIKDLLRRWLESNKSELVWVADLVEEANARLEDRHAAIGPSHFLRDDLDEDWVATIWKHAVIPYLSEQFFGQEDRLTEFDLTTLRKAVNKEYETLVDDDAADNTH